MKVFLDTNVVIDYFGRRAPYFSALEHLSAMQEFGDAELWVSAESFSDAFYLLRKSVAPDLLQSAFVKSLEFLNVCSVGEAEVAEAAQRSWTDFEDCLIDVCAEKVKADFILTRDRDGFKRSRIASYAPDEFFNMLEHEHGVVYETLDW